MSMRKWVARRLLAVLGGAGLAFGICVSQASAQLPPPFSNANWANRYTCTEVLSAGGLFDTGQMNIFPNGSGTFVSGKLVAPVTDNAIAGAFNDLAPPTGNFCTYALDVAGSSYLINSNGIGVQVLNWSPTVTTGPCIVPAAYNMSETIVLRTNGVRPSGAVVRAETTSNNFLDESAAPPSAGDGRCLK